MGFFRVAPQRELVTLEISNERNFVRKEYEFGFDVRNAIPVMITEGPSSGTNFSLAHV